MEIVFKCTNTLGVSGFYIDPPTPAKLHVPDWYKNMPNTIDKQKKSGLSVDNNMATNSTLKGCSPFLDGLTSGYMYCAPADIEVRRLSDNNVTFKWRSDDPFITLHNEEQHPGLPNPVEMEKSNHGTVLKWASPFTIVTPKGYSCLFTHPFNRHDLPFRTFTGVVDTDSFGIPVQFPFQMISEVNDILIIEKGTPVCQILPFKRENWTNKVEIEDAVQHNKRHFNYVSTIVKSYKKNHWNKKVYE